ncbi:MAG: hypothetical protein J7L07_05895 [Candidatus Odinarchaeota archaeon]|nr:hypothetical protein [Candidatus Odinarchaeota archaeon]
MPSWEIHNKWAEKLGIPSDISNYVNKLIDFPERVKEFIESYADTDKWWDEWKKKSPRFPLDPEYIREVLLSEDEMDKKIRKDLLQIRHDAGRKGKPLGGSRYEGLAAHVQLKFLSLKGEDYVRAWFLHHLLDYMMIEMFYAPFSLQEIFERLEERTESKIPEEVKQFVRDNLTEILKDLEKQD